MAPELTPRWSERAAGAGSGVMTGALALGVPLAAGFIAARLIAPSLSSRYFPWITGRALGLASYLSLGALVSLGAWMRHPWRLRRPVIHGAARLGAHAALGVATLALVAGHLVALASDKYAGVGWIGAFVPGKSEYRTFAVALGVVCFFAVALFASSARLAGTLGGRQWLTVHRLAASTWALAWLHGVLAGTDTRALRPFYLGTGAAVLALVVSRYVAGADRPGPAAPVASAAHQGRSGAAVGGGSGAEDHARVTTGAR